MRKTIYVLIIVGISCTDRGSDEPVLTGGRHFEIHLTPEQISKNNIRWARPQQREITEKISATGTIDVPPKNLATVSAVVPGFVKYIDLYVGSYVKRGETLTTLYHPDYVGVQQDYLKAYAQETAQAKEKTRQQELANENISARKSLERAEVEYAIAYAQLKAIESRLKLMNLSPEKVLSGTISQEIVLTAPISGYISAININIGKYVSTSDHIFSIVDKSHMHVELTVFENDAVKVAKDQKVTFTVSGSQKEYKASVYLVGKTLNEVTKSLSVHCHIDKAAEAELIPGMFVNAHIDINNEHAWTLPKEAVIQRDGKHFVFMKDEDEFRLLTVQGARQVGDAVIFIPDDTLTPNSDVVVSGVLSLYGQLFNSDDGDH